MSMTTLNDQDICACGLLLRQGTAHSVAQASAAIFETEAGGKPNRLGGQRPFLVALRSGESHFPGTALLALLVFQSPPGCRVGSASWSDCDLR